MSLPFLSFFWLNSPYNINFITPHDLRQDVALVYIRKSTPSPHPPTKSGLTWLWLVRVHMSIFEEVQRNPNYAFSLSYLFLKKSLVQISIALLWWRGNKEEGGGDHAKERQTRCPVPPEGQKGRMAVTRELDSRVQAFLPKLPSFTFLQKFIK